MSETNEIILSGIRPTGRLHYGNYFGAIKLFIDLQEQSKTCYYFVADYHALTTIKSTTDYYRQTIDMLRTYVACGLDPTRSVVYRQSDLPCTAELSLLLGMVANVGLLERGTTYKDTVAKLPGGTTGGPEGNPISYGLLGYPVLMAADILIVRADIVPVGNDQRQHVEMAQVIAEKFNHRFGETLKVPKTVARDSLRIAGLDGTAKMGKSEDNFLALLDDPKTVLKKIKAVVTSTDPLPLEGESNEPGDIIPQLPPSLGALYQLLSLTAPADVFEDFVVKYRAGEKFYGTLKKTLAEYIDKFNEPIIEGFHRPGNDEAYIRDFLSDNAKKVTPVAVETVETCREAMGIGRSIYRA